MIESHIVAIVVAFPLLLLAGCAETEYGSSPAVDTAGVPEPDQPRGSEPGDADAPRQLALQTSMDINECTARGIGLNYPVDLAPRQRPEGWPAPTLISAFGLELYQCERFAWNGFERGPVVLLLEGETILESVPQCTTPNTNSELLVHQAFANDLQLVDALRTDLGLNIRLAAFDWHSGNGGVANPEAIEWSVDGGGASRVDLAYLARPGPAEHQLRPRYLWFNETSMTAWDLELTYLAPEVPVTAGVGRFSAPMTWAERGHEVLPLGVNIWKTAEGPGTVTTWDNHFCEP